MSFPQKHQAGSEQGKGEQSRELGFSFVWAGHIWLKVYIY
jgi:hypothetical protein